MLPPMLAMTRSTKPSFCATTSWMQKVDEHCGGHDDRQRLEVVVAHIEEPDRDGPDGDQNPHRVHRAELLRHAPHCAPPQVAGPLRRAGSARARSLAPPSRRASTQ